MVIPCLKSLFIAGLAAGLLFVTACVSRDRPAGPAPTAPVALPESGMTPVPVTVVPALFSPLEKPALGRGMVVGRVFDLSGTTPVSLTPVYLGRVYRSESSGLFALDIANAPQSVTQADGSFVITNVEPAEYVLAVGSASSIKTPSVLAEPNGNVKVFIVTHDAVTNLGDVRVDYLDR
jgi:hypothetical protein